MCSGPDEVKSKSELRGVLLGVGESWNTCVSDTVPHGNTP